MTGFVGFRAVAVAAVSTLFLTVLVLQSPSAAAVPFAGNETRIADIVYELAETAFGWVVTHNCNEQPYLQTKCNDLLDISSKDVRLYYGGLLADNDSVVAVLPDNDAQLTGRPHDMFLVLDPFPAYKFGHPMFMFYVDFDVIDRMCENSYGIPAAFDDNTTACIHVIRSRWCNERPMTSSWDCKVTFLPLIVPARSSRLQANNVLTCLSSKDTFLMNCPELQDDQAETWGQCNNLKTNDRGCGRNNFKCNAQRPVNQAVMLFGGWSRNLADFVTMYDLVSLKNRITSWGFEENNIQTFFGNGINMSVDDDGNEYSTNISNVEPADKMDVRRYIKGVCSAPRCTDTFFLYISSPTKRDGNAMLWDANGNGLAENDEVYATKEFLLDISLCAARRVVVFVDQSFSAALSMQAAQFARRRLENVMIVPTTNLDDWTPRHSFSAYMRESSKNSCLSEYVKKNDLLQQALLSGIVEPFQESQIMPPVFTGYVLEQEMRNITITGLKPCAH